MCMRLSQYKWIIPASESQNGSREGGTRSGEERKEGESQRKYDGGDERKNESCIGW